MNRERRKMLTEAFDKIGEVKEILEIVKEEECESLENLPDSFRYGEQGEQRQNYIDMMDEAYGSLLEAESLIEQI